MAGFASPHAPAIAAREMKVVTLNRIVPTCTWLVVVDSATREAMCLIQFGAVLRVDVARASVPAEARGELADSLHKLTRVCFVSALRQLAAHPRIPQNMSLQGTIQVPAMPLVCCVVCAGRSLTHHTPCSACQASTFAGCTAISAALQRGSACGDEMVAFPSEAASAQAQAIPKRRASNSTKRSVPTAETASTSAASPSKRSKIAGDTADAHSAPQVPQGSSDTTASPRSVAAASMRLTKWDCPKCGARMHGRESRLLKHYARSPGCDPNLRNQQTLMESLLDVVKGKVDEETYAQVLFHACCMLSASLPQNSTG